MAARFIIVAIDGGAASGKSSTARALSGHFHLLHADTGSYFRAVTAELLRRGVAPGDPAAVERAVRDLHLDTQVRGRSAGITIGGRAPGDEIRSPEVNAAVSHFAAIPALRSQLVDYERGQAEVARQRGFAGLVMDGRDIGTVIFPSADFRFFLHADPAERARRRAKEGQADAVAERDRLDSSRTTAPLVCPPGATSIDTTHHSLAEVVARLVATIEGAAPAA
ncbi:MAG TPA: (d)CMP kinase [Opitutaceae bacterium]|jgi:cytidylate kinase